MKLQQISNQETLTQSVVQQMILNATALEFAEFYSIVGNADYTRKESTASGGQFRAVNMDYSANPVTPEYANPVLKILGDKVEVDQAFERRGLDIASVRARDLLKFAKNLGKKFQYYFFNGTGANNQFSGLKLIVPNAQKITAATNGLQVLLGNTNDAKQSQQKFLELINQMIELVDGGAQVIFMNGFVLSRLTTIAREQIQYQVNEFGVPVPFYNGIPVRNAGYNTDGSLNIPMNEVVGTSNDCTSVYAVRFGEATDLSFATNVGVEVKDLGLVGNFYTHRVELDVDLVLLNPKAVARLEGIRL